MAVLWCCISLLPFWIIYTITSHALILHEIKLDSFFKDYHTTKLYFSDMNTLKTHHQTQTMGKYISTSSFSESCSMTQLHFCLFSDYNNCFPDSVGSKYSQNICFWQSQYWETYERIWRYIFWSKSAPYVMQTLLR